MGVLYYFKKEDADEAFALNKVYRYAAETFYDAYPLREFVPANVFGGWALLVLEPTDKPEMRAWYQRIAKRLKSWAGDSRIALFTENDDEWADCPLTGSAHDSDYEADGVTYKIGSAW
jgi:hypothetical protein